MCLTIKNGFYKKIKKNYIIILKKNKMKDQNEFSSFSLLAVLDLGSGSHWLAINRGWEPKTPLSYRQ